MGFCFLARIQSRVKGHHVYNYAFKVGKILNCSIENDNEYSDDTITVSSGRKKMVGHTLELLAKIIIIVY